jgi:hypothetical protein
MIQFLQGKKTYITAAIGVILTGCQVMGYIDMPTFNTIVTILGFLGLSFLRAGVTKAQ